MWACKAPIHCNYYGVLVISWTLTQLNRGELIGWRCVCVYEEYVSVWLWLCVCECSWSAMSLSSPTFSLSCSLPIPLFNAIFSPIPLMVLSSLPLCSLILSIFSLSPSLPPLSSSLALFLSYFHVLISLHHASLSMSTDFVSGFFSRSRTRFLSFSLTHSHSLSHPFLPLSCTLFRSFSCSLSLFQSVSLSSLVLSLYFFTSFI